MSQRTKEIQPDSRRLLCLSASLVLIFFAGCKKDAPTTPTPTAAPFLVSPIDSAFVNTNAVGLVWQKIPDAEQYQCQVSQTREFATLEFDSTLAETTMVVTLSSHFKDYWRIRAKNNNGNWGEWSSPRNFNRWVIIGSDSTNDGYSVQQTTDGGFIIAGLTGYLEAGTANVYLVKTDANGNLQWSRSFNHESNIAWGSCVQHTTDGGFIVVGSTYSPAVGNYDVYLIKTDANGNHLWSRIFGGNLSDYGNSVQQTNDGGFVVVGRTFSFGAGGYDVYLIKTDADGNEQWARTFGGVRDDIGRSVRQTTDGGFIVVGTTSSFGAGNEDVYLIKTDANGNQQWSRTFGGSSYDRGFSVEQTTNGGFIVAGSFAASGGYSDVYLIKTDANGNIGR